MTNELPASPSPSKLLQHLPALVLAVVICILAWFGHKYMEESDRRSVAQKEELARTVTELSQTTSRLKQLEQQLAALESHSTNVRSELVKLQRGSYDHERMLSTLFKIEKVGDSVASFKTQDGQSFSIGASK